MSSDHHPLSLRRTDRTTRMLEAAAAEIAAGRKVLVVVHDGARAERPAMPTSNVQAQTCGPAAPDPTCDAKLLLERF